MSFSRSTIIVPVCFALVFLLTGLVTVSHYNVNWDEPAHFARGQAYLHFFLTGNKNYRDLPNFDEFWEYIWDRKNKPSNIPRYSIYQNSRNMEHFLEKDSGHPPLNGILAAFSNYIFYQKLNILGDIDSYHVLILFIASLLIVLVGTAVQKEYGLFASVVSMLAIGTYPAFLAESHNNIKDPIETTFFTLALYCLYRAVQKKTRKLILVASIFAGLALATKFNIVMVPIIICVWILLTSRARVLLKFIPSNFVLILVYLLIPIAIFYGSWPYLWQHPIGNLLKVLSFYGTIGTGAANQPQYLVGSINTYPIFWILYTTPLITLFLFLIGVVFFILKFKNEKNKLSHLAIIWFFITVGRVTFSGFSIYGGVRQIMEYIPAMAILAGIGAHYLSRRKVLVQIVIILLFIPIIIRIVSIHPHEVVYFNPLIGGLKGAKAKNFPSWGFSLGNAYRQAVAWINNNAPPNAQVALVVNTAQVIPPILFRDDIEYNNGAWSGEEKKGEYLIETIFDGWMRVYYYPAEYVERMLEPVYEVKVDDVVIAKVWKNDIEHTRPEFRSKVAVDSKNIAFKQRGKSIEIALDEEARLTNVSIYYETNNCVPITGGEVFISTDGEAWRKLAQPIVERYADSEKLFYPIAGWSGRFIKFELSLVAECPMEILTVQVTKVL